VGKNCEAQNLVPNPGFEVHTDCPNTTSQAYLINNWIYESETPDYFNRCDTTNLVSIPQNFIGFQSNISDAYIGILVRDMAPPNYREIIGAALNDSLLVGQKYFASIKVSLADCMNWATNNIGLLLTTLPIDFSLSQPPNRSHIHSQVIIEDTSNWVIVSGEFIADSSYKYVFIGNFYDDINTDSLLVYDNHCQLYISDTTICNSYYYIDDVCVSPDSLACDLNPEGIYNLKEVKTSINLYPNPATNQLTIESVGSKQFAEGRIEITNSLGVTVYTESGNLKSKTAEGESRFQRIINLKSLASGIYFIKLYFSDGEMEVKKFVKE
jgi:hypothetical protein